MSGFVGIVNVTGKLFDRLLLQRMTRFLTYRGPDAQDVWVHGHVGFGTTKLATMFEARSERQPCTLDGQVWIAADARIDDRAGLIAELDAKDRRGLESAPDASLILAAYLTWGEECVEHLLGDFAFAIWNEERKQLFCARDHFGVKPFFYARLPGTFILSNTLNCLRLHPAVSDELNEAALGDFLLFGYNQDLSTTAFADIQRLPPGHRLTLDRGSLSVRRYWTLPLEEPLRYRDPHDYPAHFRELLETAVRDRLRTDRVGVLMSGGTDSTFMAALAHQALAKGGRPCDLQAYTVVFDRLFPDEEGRYAGLVGEALGVDVHYLNADGYTLFERWDQPEFWKPEPYDNPFEAIAADLYRETSRRCRVVLTGEGGDPSFRWSSRSYFARLLRGPRWGKLVMDAGRCLANGWRPGSGSGGLVKHLLGKDPWRPVLPPWIAPDFAARRDLRSRWERHVNDHGADHPSRPEAYLALTSSFWPYIFESYDPGFTEYPVELRYPYFDLRLLRYVLRVPPVPWFVNKKLLRDAMQGFLPDVVRLRPKAPLPTGHICAVLRRDGSGWMDTIPLGSELGRYLDLSKVPDRTGVSANIDRYESHEDCLTRPFSLAHWLRYGYLRAEQASTTTAGGSSHEGIGAH